MEQIRIRGTLPLVKRGGLRNGDELLCYRERGTTKGDAPWMTVWEEDTEADTKALVRMENDERAGPKGLGTRKWQYRCSGDDYNLQLHTHSDDVGLAGEGGGASKRREKATDGCRRGQPRLLPWPPDVA